MIRLSDLVISSNDYISSLALDDATRPFQHVSIVDIHRLLEDVVRGYAQEMAVKERIVGELSLDMDASPLPQYRLIWEAQPHLDRKRMRDLKACMKHRAFARAYEQRPTKR